MQVFYQMTRGSGPRQAHPIAQTASSRRSKKLLSKKLLSKKLLSKKLLSKKLLS
jgi:hypothetical protein